MGVRGLSLPTCSANVGCWRGGKGIGDKGAKATGTRGAMLQGHAQGNRDP